MSSHLTYDFLASAQTFAEFLDAFERGKLPKAIWTHAAHLAVATWYLVTFPEGKAIDRVRTGIRHYNECVGTANTEDSGYHETLTIFWLKMIGRFLEETGTAGGKLDEVRRVVDEFSGRRDLFRQYYSFDVVGSRQARARWVRVPPDGRLRMGASG
jgi:hypothetical protein